MIVLKSALVFFFSSRRRHTRFDCDWSSDVCSSDLLSQDKLVDTERVQQTDLTRSLAQEIQQFESNLTQQLLSERQILALTGLIDNVEDTAAEPKVTRLLENFVQTDRRTFIYLTAVGKSGKGTSASQGNFRAKQDPF